MSQRIYAGLGSISKLIQILEESNSKNILLVTGKKSFSLSGAEKVLQPLINRFNITRFQDFEINPTFEDSLKGTFVSVPQRDQIPENIKEQLIVELYSK